jgi:hypothetical protein
MLALDVAIGNDVGAFIDRLADRKILASDGTLNPIKGQDAD